MKNFFYLSVILCLTLFSACIKEDIVDQVVPETEDLSRLQAPSDVLVEGKIATQEVLASFDIELTNGTTDEKAELKLTNNSEHAVAYEWSFGNGDTSIDEIPSYKYNLHGYYTVTLKATGANGDVSEMSKEVLVLCIYGGGNHGF